MPFHSFRRVFQTQISLTCGAQETICSDVTCFVLSLQTWPTTILVVSHDRQFLNTIVTDVFHMHSQRIDVYKGDYDLFVRNREDKLKNQQKEFEAQKHYRDHIQVSFLAAVMKLEIPVTHNMAVSDQ